MCGTKNSYTGTSGSERLGFPFPWLVGLRWEEIKCGRVNPGTTCKLRKKERKYFFCAWSCTILIRSICVCVCEVCISMYLLYQLNRYVPKPNCRADSIITVLSISIIHHRMHRIHKYRPINSLQIPPPSLHPITRLLPLPNYNLHWL